MTFKILVVEDSRVDLALLRSVIEDAGHDVIEATNGKQAIEQAIAEHPDLIFMDVVMRGEDGYDACRNIKKHESTRNIPVVFVTSKHKQADRVWAELQGADGFVTKPFSREDILLHLQQHVANKNRPVNIQPVFSQKQPKT